MNICFAIPLFLSSSDHHYNVTLQFYGPSAMFLSDVIPALPPNTVTETNQEYATYVIIDIQQKIYCGYSRQHMVVLTYKL